MARTKKKSSKGAKPPEDIEWCRKNLNRLTPRAYFDQFRINNRQTGHHRYKMIIDTYITKKHRKRLRSSFELWRNSDESNEYWRNRARSSNKTSIGMRAAEVVKSAVDEEFDLFGDINNSPLSSQEITTEEEREEEGEQEEEEEEEEEGVEQRNPYASQLDELDDSFTSFISTDKHPDAESYYNCLDGAGSHVWSPVDQPAVAYRDWIISDTINVTKLFKAIRSSSMKAAEQLERISSIRILILSHIFVISPDIDESIGSLLPSINETILQSTNIFEKTISPDAAVLWANSIMNSDYTNPTKLQELFLSIKANALTFSDPAFLKHADYLEDFAKFYRPPHSNDTEDNLVDRLKQLLKHVFDSNNYVLNANTKHLEEAEDFIPDFKVSIKGKSGKLFDVFILESKLSERCFFPHQNDFIKLQLEMQVMLNALIKNNIDNPKIFGMLSKGLKCKIYIMWLEYDGIYVCREVKAFTLPESVDQILLCPSILSIMLSIKKKIDLLATTIINKKKGKSPLANLSRVGFNSPVLVPNPLANSQ